MAHADEAAAAVTTAFKGGDDLAAGAIAYGDDVGDAAALACSFTPDTPVATPDGARPIGELAVGDLVLAADPDTGALASRPVAAVLVHPDTVTGTVSIEGERIATTPEHPFAVLGEGFVAAADLVPGDRVLRSDGTTGTVSEIRWDGGPAPMWNLTVAVDHTFFVGEGAWWVHNACGGIGPVLKGQQGVSDTVSEIVAAGGTRGQTEVTFSVPGHPGTVKVDSVNQIPSIQQHGGLTALEVKTGSSAKLNPNQQRLLPLLAKYGGIPHGANAIRAGLKPGTLTPINVRIVWRP